MSCDGNRVRSQHFESRKHVENHKHFESREAEPAPAPQPVPEEDEKFAASYSDAVKATRDKGESKTLNQSKKGA